MATEAPNSSRTSAGMVEALAGLERARARTLALVDKLDDAQLEQVHSPLMSPLVWDLGHIAAYEDLWLAHRLGERELLRSAATSRRSAQRRRVTTSPRYVRGASRRSPSLVLATA